ncbi:MAG: glycerophosphodiester phosphodiesterase [Clostridia bacterium]|nr:glycerophosphodiester phosphodiesterase [Clostridia bacterium]MBR2413555.1 glycerophosphodiester phosphodiesterase [Clostridia bacterium]MBR3954461.1 glycerophosphodiester phosphodiesterase [Clostridia bacterium]
MVPNIIAHRGAKACAPQNTIPSFERAVADLADGFETDVHLTKDGIPVICHNYDIDETSNGTGFIEKMTLEELRRFDFGAWYGEEFKGTTIPTLNEFLAVAKKADIKVLNIEIKRPPSRLKELVEKTLAAVEEYGLTDRLLISSFSVQILRYVKQCAPAIPTGFLYPSNNPSACYPVVWPAAMVRFTKCDCIHPLHKLVSAPLVKWAHKKGMVVNVWTVNEEEDIKRMLLLGVDGIITDNPAYVREVVGTCVQHIR